MPLDTTSVPGVGAWVGVGVADGGGGEGAGVLVDEGGGAVVGCRTDGVADGLAVAGCFAVGCAGACVAARAGALAALVLAEVCGAGVR
jgi:hypothetical protein